VLRDLRAEDAAWLGMAVAVIVAAVLVVGVQATTTAPDAELELEGELEDYERLPIPFALLADSEGRRTTLRELAHERPQLLVFLSTYCGACVEIAAQLPSWRAQLGPVEIQLVFVDELDKVPAKVTAPGIHVWHDVERGATDTFAATGKPAAVLLGADGLLAGGPTIGQNSVTTFVEDIIAELNEVALETETAHLAEPADGIPGRAYS
jgi:cytochrome oxidase Cu insertion factor (SCO1/SenC/PrrC family)